MPTQLDFSLGRDAILGQNCNQYNRDTGYAGTLLFFLEHLLCIRCLDMPHSRHSVSFLLEPSINEHIVNWRKLSTQTHIIAHRNSLLFMRRFCELQSILFVGVYSGFLFDDE